MSDAFDDYQRQLDDLARQLADELRKAIDEEIIKDFIKQAEQIDTDNYNRAMKGII